MSPLMQKALGPFQDMTRWQKFIAAVGIPGVLALIIVLKPHIDLTGNDFTPMTTVVAQVREDVKVQAAALAAQTEILRTLTDLARRQTVAMESLVRLNRTSCMNTANLAKDKEAALRECLR